MWPTWTGESLQRKLRRLLFPLPSLSVSFPRSLSPSAIESHSPRSTHHENDPACRAVSVRFICSWEKERERPLTLVRSFGLSRSCNDSLAWSAFTGDSARDSACWFGSILVRWNARKSRKVESCFVETKLFVSMIIVYVKLERKDPIISLSLSQFVLLWNLPASMIANRSPAFVSSV